MRHRRNAVGIFMLCVIMGCSYQASVRHYTGTAIRLGDQTSDGLGTYAEPVEATYFDFHSGSMLRTHAIQTGRRDTLSFHKFDTAWRLTNDPHGEVKIHRTSDSLTVSLVWSYSGESFYLKQDSEWVVPVYVRPMSRFRLW